MAYGKALKATDRLPGGVPVYGSNGPVGWHDTALVTGPGVVVGRKGNPGIVKYCRSDFFPIDTTFFVRMSDVAPSMTFWWFMLEHLDLPRFAADSAVPGLNRNMASSAQVIVPDLFVLRRFDDVTEPLLATMAHAETETRTLAELRDTLLPKLMSGEIRVRDAEKEVEAVA